VNKDMKQMIVMRKDLNMRKGKLVAQGAHASMKATLSNLEHPNVKEWLSGKFTKVAVSVDSEEELMDIHSKALSNGLISELIIDEGLTEFNGVFTKTCIAVGPATHEELKEVTGHLKLL
jgi:PTH2 family peptidyl-tRNA hydrolase